LSGRTSHDASGGARVDVAITAYRRAAYLREAIESVLEQSFSDWRLRISHNGLGGGAIEEAARPYLDDPRVDYVATGRELPLAESWSAAIGRGTAPYVALLNDDDRWHRGFLETRVAALDAHPECGFAFGEFRLVDETGGLIELSSLAFPKGVVPRERLAEALVRRSVAAPPTILVRRSGYYTVGAAFDGRWHYCDWEMWARLGSRFPAYYVAEHDSDYRRHPQTNTLATVERPETLLGMLQHLEQLFTREVEGFRLSARSRARIRSDVLLASAADVHEQGGWKVSGSLYRRALREYPPSALSVVSLRLLARSLLGQRITHVLGSVLRPPRSDARRGP
jgi:glycosyltransferase involved in cell wall biosynthesis